MAYPDGWLFTETTMAASPIQPFVMSNAAGETYGMIQDPDGIYRTYVIDAAGAKTLVQPPDAALGQLASVSGPPGTGYYVKIYSINSSGVVVGHYIDGHGVIHGFIDDHGVYQTVDVPGASATWVQGIDDEGRIYGSYQGPSGELKFLGANGGAPFRG